MQLQFPSKKAFQLEIKLMRSHAHFDIVNKIANSKYYKKGILQE